jgi:hypothetical protein
MSPYKADFTGPLVEEKRVIRGFEGSKVYTIYKGTLLLSIQDDDGVIDEVRIPNSYYVPSCPYRIISPQHWAQEVQESTDDGTGCVTYSDRAVLFWKGGTRKKTVMIDKQNVFTFDLPSGYKKFHEACATCFIDPLKEDEQPAVIPPIDLTCHLFHPDRDGPRRDDPEMIDKSEVFFPSRASYPKEAPTLLTLGTNAEEGKKKTRVTMHPSVKVQLRSSLRKNKQDPQVTSRRLKAVAEKLATKQTAVTSVPENLFHVDEDVQETSPAVVTEETLQKPTENDSAELLRYHYKFGHVSFARLQAMAKQGTLPAKLAKCPLPVCASCFYGKATKRATGTKTPISRRRK